MTAPPTGEKERAIRDIRDRFPRAIVVPAPPGSLLVLDYLRWSDYDGGISDNPPSIAWVRFAAILRAGGLI